MAPVKLMLLWWWLIKPCWVELYGSYLLKCCCLSWIMILAAFE
jgi:hypothetical protein